MLTRALALLSLAVMLTACHRAENDGGVDLSSQATYNPLAYIPAQCFTRTKDTPGSAAQNPCFACHNEARAPNYLGQPELQLSYALPQIRAGHGIINPWTNLFLDRREAIARVSDTDILNYVQRDNYFNARGEIDLANRLRQVPARWDVDRNGQWNGYIPDTWFHFDAQGFDTTPDGRLTGWRTFSYYPFPGAFLPTNGSFDDVLIRLPEAFRRSTGGREDRTVYIVNLAIVEAMIRRQDVAIDPVDEAALGADLDRDGKLGTASRIVFDWEPVKGRNMSYVGEAGVLQKSGKVHLAAGLFPEGTEFLHSVRYLDVENGSHVVPAKRMKELRYARKKSWLTYGDLNVQAIHETNEDTQNPDRPAEFFGSVERGMSNDIGWAYQGFIEDRNGELRPQTHEETVYCMGCHGRLSATDDGIFSFSRKISGGQGRGWQHWLTQYRQPLPDPLTLAGQPEYAGWLRQNHAGDEFRANDEVKTRFFNADGTPKADAFAALGRDINTLLLPSAQRALTLDKAYRLIVQEQSFIKGRDPVVAPARNVWKEIGLDEATGIAEPVPTAALR